MKLDQVALEGALVRLEPLEDRHFEAILAAALSDPAIFTHMPYRVIDRSDVERMFAIARSRQEARTAVVFATCAGPDRQVVGSTAIGVSDPNTPSVEIGSTWIVPAWQRTRVNTEAKLLQMTHAFEALGVARTEWKTDARNTRSRAAIRRLGAVEEGTLRHHMRRHDGTMRDSVYFSILASEWPAAKARLVERLTRG